MRYSFNPFSGKLEPLSSLASEISIADAGGYYTGTNVEAALQEIGAGTTLDSRYLKLDASNSPVTGNLTISANLTANNVYVPDGGFVGVSGADGWTFDSTNGDITTTSKVGIGLTSLNDKLEVSGSVDIQGGGALKLAGTIRINSSGNVITETIIQNKSSDLHIRQMDDYDIKFDTNNIERMRITNTGDVGIGTASPAEKLHVSGGHIQVDTDYELRTSNFQKYVPDADSLSITGTNFGLMTATNGLIFSYNANNTSGAGIFFGQGTTDPGDANWVAEMRIIDGNVGIGTASPSSNADLTLEGGALCIKETTTPTADTNYGKIYSKSDNNLYFQDGAGNEHQVAFV